MSLLSVLKTIGQDLGTFGKWVEEALPVAGSIISVVDPPLAPIVTAVEGILHSLTAATGKAVSPAEAQQITAAVTLLQAVQATIDKHTVASLSLNKIQTPQAIVP